MSEFVDFQIILILLSVFLPVAVAIFFVRRNNLTIYVFYLTTSTVIERCYGMRGKHATLPLILLLNYIQNM